MDSKSVLFVQRSATERCHKCNELHKYFLSTVFQGYAEFVVSVAFFKVLVAAAQVSKTP